MRRKIKSLLTIIGVLLFFVIISPMKAEARDIIIVYGEPNGFKAQAQSMQRKYTPSAAIYTCRTSDDFLNRWNWIRGNYERRGTKFDNLIIMVHGGKGKLYFKNSTFTSFSKLSYLGPCLKGNVMLLSCHGGTGGSSSVAFKLAKKSGKKVIASKNSSVNYNIITKDPYLDNRKKGKWVKIYCVKGKYLCDTLGTTWKFSYLK